MKWFKHDARAGQDAKLKRVKIKYGMTGYGLYWYCLELIAAEVSPENINFELEHDAEIIAHDTGINYELVQEMILYMVELGLFENANGVVTCLKLAKRLDQSMTSNPEMRKIIKQIGESGKLNSVNNHDCIKMNHDLIMTESEQIRLDKIRLEKTKGRFTPPTLNEVQEYCESRKNNINPDDFLNHYQANGWMRGKNKIKDWKACVRTWEKNQPKPESYAPGAI